MRRIQRTTSSSSSNNNQRELQNNLPVIVIDDSTDEDTSILQQTTPPRRNNTAHPVVHNDTLPIAVSDDETTLNPFSPSSPLPFNLWSDADESSEYESSSDEDEAPNHNNIDNILERLTREEERATVSPRQTPPTVVQYPSMSNNNNNNRNNNRNNNYYQPNRMINNHTNSSNNNNHSLPFLMNNNSNNSNNNNNNSNRNLLHQHRMQSTSATAARIPIQASRRFVTPTASTNNRTPFTYPAHHHFHVGGIPNNAQPMAFTSPTLERMVEQHILAQVIARSHHHHDVGGAIHPLMFVNRDFDDRDYEMLLALDDNVETTSKKTAASVVGKLPIVHIEEKECTCSICLEDLEVGSFASEIPFCNHKFHTECIEKWLKDYGHTCPVCKQEVTEIDFNHAKIIKEEVNNKRKGFSNKNVSESKFKKKKVE